VSNAADVVKVHQKVEVRVVEVDVVRKRISLSMKMESAPKPKHDHKKQDKSRKFVKPAVAGQQPAGGQHQHKKPVKPQPGHKGGQKEKPLPDGDLQLKLEALKNLFKS
jgi:uncharacterized protein